MRSQTLEHIQSANESSSGDASKSSTSITDWCHDADDWDDDHNANLNEKNGNVINNVEKGSDEDDESCSFEELVRSNLGNMTIDDKNANNGVAHDLQGNFCGCTYVLQQK